LSFDLARTLRRLKPATLKANLARRPAGSLPFVTGSALLGPQLLLDTTVYIDALQSTSPREVNDLITVRVCNHSAVCLAELTHAFGRLAPGHPSTAAALAAVGKVIDGMRPHRIREPSRTVWGTAGILAGMVFRMGGYKTGQERELLNDALIFLQAVESGYVVLTANVGDFDMLGQLVPEGRVLFYNRSS
jgi:predicted nucleic acid-binding protein